MSLFRTLTAPFKLVSDTAKAIGIYSKKFNADSTVAKDEAETNLKNYEEQNCQTFYMKDEIQTKILCKNPIIDLDETDAIDVASIFLRNPLPDHFITTVSISHFIEKSYKGELFPSSRLWFDFNTNSGEPFFKRNFFRGDDLSEIDARHQGFCIDCHTYDIFSFSDINNFKLRKTASFSSRFCSELYAEICDNNVMLDFSIDLSFFGAISADITYVGIDTTVQFQDFINMCEVMRHSIPPDVLQLALS